MSYNPEKVVDFFFINANENTKYFRVKLKDAIGIDLIILPIIMSVLISSMKSLSISIIIIIIIMVLITICPKMIISVFFLRHFEPNLKEFWELGNAVYQKHNGKANVDQLVQDELSEEMIALKYQTVKLLNNDYNGLIDYLNGLIFLTLMTIIEMIISFISVPILVHLIIFIITLGIFFYIHIAFGYYFKNKTKFSENLKKEIQNFKPTIKFYIDLIKFGLGKT
jgi:flagellar basal body-associated protein FliL